jgi:membrane-anchored protein YejM (alkaline phosphatase superfamily)
MSGRRQLLRWVSWFALVNAALMGIVGLRYLWEYSPISPAVAWPYAVVAYVGHLTALAYVPLVLLLVPVIVLLPRPRVILSLGVLLASAGVAFMVLDTLVFAENRYHLNVLTFVTLEPPTWAFLALYFLLGVVIESMLAVWAWRRTALPLSPRVRWSLALALGSCFVVGHLAHAWAEPHYYVPVTAFSRYLPLYSPLKLTGLLSRLGLVDRYRARERGLVAALGRAPDRELNYPLAPLRCDPRPPALNVLLVVIDGMRADALTPAAAPRLSEFARDAIRFDGHFSGGNSSRSGVFSLFYGLPATYFEAFYDFARPPVLMDMFRQYDYQFGLFSSSPVYRAVVGLDRTALARVPNLRLDTGSPYPGSAGRDRSLTEEWYDWLQRRDPAHPFFGFLYYNAAVAVEPPDGYPPVTSVASSAPAQVRRHARYLSAVHFVDSLVGSVLDDLGRRKLLDRTVVIVTSDHGIEFDETGQGFKGHGTAFSDYQMRTPLVLRWPGRPPGRIERRTSHNDLAPTVLTELFGCTNPPSDYASGYSLFAEKQWDWLVARSRTDYALIEPERVTIVYSSGYEIRDRAYRLVRDPTLPRDGLRAALREMGRFYR